MKNIQSRRGRVPTQRIRIALFAGLISLLAACGSSGGGGGAGSTSTTTTITAPGAPTIGAATAGNGSVTITFNAPASNGGAAITAYTATCASGAQTFTATGAASPLIVTGLASGTIYSCTVAAANSAGTGAASAAVNVTLAASVTVPGAPTISSISGGNASAVIAFNAPASNGGAAISGYVASCNAASGAITANGTASPITVSGLSNGVTYACTVAAINSAGTGAASASSSVTPTAPTTSASVDPTKLPVGDGKVSTTTPQVGYVYACSILSGGGGASSKGPWFNSDGTTWNATLKISVQGAVKWASTFATTLATTLGISGNGLPSHNTGTFPIASTDPAYAYDRNPNSIGVQTIAWGLPANPVVAATPTCLPGGAIGVLLTGARLFNALDAENRDAVAWEMQDSCQGHPERTGAYHYHNLSSCVPQTDVPGQHSPLVGYARDGFGIYGNQGVNGVALTNADLDVCHGHTHAITVNGATVTQYHYHATKEYPYTLGCFRGTPVSAS